MGKIAALFFKVFFINGYERCHITDSAHDQISFIFNCKQHKILDPGGTEKYNYTIVCAKLSHPLQSYVPLNFVSEWQLG